MANEYPHIRRSDRGWFLNAYYWLYDRLDNFDPIGNDVPSEGSVIKRPVTNLSVMDLSKKERAGRDSGLEED